MERKEICRNRKGNLRRDIGFFAAHKRGKNIFSGIIHNEKAKNAMIFLLDKQKMHRFTGLNCVI